MTPTIEVIPAKSREACSTTVVFSSVNANGFSFYNMCMDLSDDMHLIFVRDPHDQWYDRGISAEIPDWRRLRETVASALKTLGSKRFATFGASMGAYASLRMAAELKADMCLAVSPQTVLDLRLPHTPAKPVSGPGHDLKPLLDAWAPREAHVFFGAADFVDIYNVLRIGWRDAGLHSIAGQDHLVAQFLARAGILKALLADFAAEGSCLPARHLAQQKIQTNRSCFDPIQHQLISRIVEGYYLQAPWNVVAHIKALDALAPWADAKHMLAKINLKKGNIEQAIKYGEQARGLAPSSVTISDALAEIFYSADRLDEALEAYKTSLSLRKKHYNAFCKIGLIHARRGELDQARAVLTEAMEIRPRLTTAQTIAERYDIILPPLEAETR